MTSVNRAVLVLMFAIVFALLGFESDATAIPAPGRGVLKRPNIVMILSDDQSYHDVGCYGNKQIHTPNIDQLAKEGMRFTRCFTATAMCAPTRQQLYTGVFPVRNGAYPNHSKVHAGTKSMVHHLKALGYRVGLSGKKHFGPADSFPFVNVGKKMKQFIAGWKEGKKFQPYCLVITSKSPHLPWTAGDANRYDPKKMQVPPYLVDTPELRVAMTKYYAEITDFDREVGEAMKLVKDSEFEENTIFIYTSEQGAQFPFGKWTCYDVGLQTALVIRWPKRVKAGSVTDAMVQYVDIVPTLIEAAGGDPTKIDTGRSGAPKGKHHNQGKGFDGKSFLAVLEGKTDEHNDVVYGCHTTRGIISGSESYPIRSIRTKTHKLIWNVNHKIKFRNTLIVSDKNYWDSWNQLAKTDAFAKQQVEKYQVRPEFELYDLRDDPFEMKNLLADPSKSAAANKLKGQMFASLKDWMAQQGDLGDATERNARKRQGR